jgi:hypothetical protein
VDHDRSRLSLRRVATVMLAALAVGLVVLARSVGLGHERAFYFGTLMTDPAKARLERGAGVRVAQISIRWDKCQPTSDSFNRRYVRSVRREIRRLRAAGMLVEAGLGLNYPPRWLFRDNRQAAYVNQYHHRYTGTPNIVFSKVVRARAQEYIARVRRDIGLAQFWAIRVGVNSDGEFIYPSADADPTHGNSYWAFDPNAQGDGADPGRAAGVPADPFPGWRPGHRTYHGRPFGAAQVRRWYLWYLGALVDAVNWQIRYYRSLGYRGYLKVLVPGTGYYPADYRTATARYLDGSVSPDLLGAGAGFFKTIPWLAMRRDVEIVSSSLVDGSGDPANNGCAPTDPDINIMAARPDPEIYDWSSVRWVADIARRSGFTLLNGESAGNHVAPYYAGVMDYAAAQMASCRLQGLMWAFDLDLYSGTPGSSLNDYAAVIRRYDR